MKHSTWTDFRSSVTPEQVRSPYQTTRFRRSCRRDLSNDTLFGTRTLVDVEQSSFENRSEGVCYLASPTARYQTSVPMDGRQRPLGPVVLKNAVLCIAGSGGNGHCTRLTPLRPSLRSR